MLCESVSDCESKLARAKSLVQVQESKSQAAIGRAALPTYTERNKLDDVGRHFCFPVLLTVDLVAFSTTDLWWREMKIGMRQCNVSSMTWSHSSNWLTVKTYVGLLLIGPFELFLFYQDRIPRRKKMFGVQRARGYPPHSRWRRLS